jgi:hypothetical protein
MDYRIPVMSVLHGTFRGTYRGTIGKGNLCIGLLWLFILSLDVMWMVLQLAFGVGIRLDIDNDFAPSSSTSKFLQCLSNTLKTLEFLFVIHNRL